MHRATSLLLATTAVLFGTASLSADVLVNVTVDSRNAPWSWVDGGLNTSFQYGLQDDNGPLVVDNTSGIAFLPGDSIAIAYVSGLTSAFGGVDPYADATGDSLYPNENDSGGSSGKFFPSLFMGPYPPDIALIELVGTFTDDTGAIAGSPFAIGSGGTFVVPVGATRLQLGVNDDQFDDNTGSWVVSVSGPEVVSSGEVPEPGSVGLLGTVLAGLAVARLRKRSA